MPAPHSFWVILIGKTPTSFRGKEREDLVPTLRQLQRTQSEVTLRWFERGKVWESPEAAEGAAKLAATEARERRTKEWRPGGEHRDPKARFEMTRDQKRAKFKRERSGPDDGSDRPGPERGRDRPAPDRSRSDAQPKSPFGPRAPRAPRAERPDRPWSDRKPAARSDRPWSDRPKFDRPKPESPFGNRGPGAPRGEGPRGGEGRSRPPSGGRPFGDRPPRRDRPSGPPPENPFKDRPRPTRPGRPPSDRGGFKPPKRRS